MSTVLPERPRLSSRTPGRGGVLDAPVSGSVPLAEIGRS